MTELTEWFPPDVKPVHVGIYETRIDVWGDPTGNSYWDGTQWWYQWTSADSTADDLRYAASAIQRKSWRGRTKPAKGGQS